MSKEYQVGNVIYQFPDTMSDDDVKGALTKNGVIKPTGTPLGVEQQGLANFYNKGGANIKTTEDLQNYEKQNPINGWPGERGMLEGVAQAVTGKNESNPGESALSSRMGGLSKTFRGAVAALAPVGLPLAIATAPLPTIAALAGGTAAGSAAEKAAQATGVEPGASSLIGDVFSLSGARLGSSLPRTVSNAFRVNPEVAVTRTFRPRQGETDFPEVAPSALSEVKTYGGAPVKTNADLESAIPRTKQALADALELWMGRSRQMGQATTGEQIVQATKNSIPLSTWKEDPAGAQAMVDAAERAYGKDANGNPQRFSVDDLHQLLKEKNAESARYHSAIPTDQNSARMVATNAAQAEAQAAAIRDTLYRTLDPENDGAGPREIQQRMGSLMALGRAAEKTGLRAMAEHPVSPAEMMSRYLMGGPSAWGKALHGDIEGAANMMLHPNSGPTDAMIGRIMDTVGDANPIPTPKAVNIKGLLGPALHQMPRVEPDDPVFEPYVDYMAPAVRQSRILRLGPGKPQATNQELGSSAGDITGTPQGKIVVGTSPRLATRSPLSDLMQGNNQ